jgi:hypothetical protein
VLGLIPWMLACWQDLASTRTQAVAEAVAVALARACAAAKMSPWQASDMASTMAVATAFLASFRVSLLPDATVLTALSMPAKSDRATTDGDQREREPRCEAWPRQTGTQALVRWHS